MKITHSPNELTFSLGNRLIENEYKRERDAEETIDNRRKQT